MAMIDVPSNARSRRTREALLSSSRNILVDKGFEALTISEIAKETGVTRRTVYLHFASRAAIVAALFDYVATTEGLQESVDRVWSAPDAVTALSEWARHFSDYHLRVLPVDRAVARVQSHDADAAAHRAKVTSAKHANCRRLAEWLDREKRLAPAWTVETCADMMTALTTSDVVETLVIDRQWTSHDFADAFATLLVSTFVLDRQ